MLISLNAVASKEGPGGETTKELYELQAEICKVFSHPKRLEILDLLRERERSVKELAERLNMTQPSLSQHLNAMWQIGIVSRTKEGQKVFYRVSSTKILKACDAIKELLMDRLREGERLMKEASEVVSG